MAKKKLRKMLGDVNTPSAIALRNLIDTQSKDTIHKWCLDYAEAKILPIFEKRCPGDDRPRNAVNAAHEYLDGKVKFPAVKNIILNECHAAARELDANPVAQAAARGVGQGSVVVHTLAFYIKVLCVVEVHALFAAWTQAPGGSTLRQLHSLTLAVPLELVLLKIVCYIFTAHGQQFVYIKLAFGKAFGEHAPQALTRLRFDIH